MSSEEAKNPRDSIYVDDDSDFSDAEDSDSDSSDVEVFLRSY